MISTSRSGNLGPLDPPLESAVSGSFPRIPQHDASGYPGFPCSLIFRRELIAFRTQWHYKRHMVSGDLRYGLSYRHTASPRDAARPSPGPRQAANHKTSIRAQFAPQDHLRITSFFRSNEGIDITCVRARFDSLQDMTRRASAQARPRTRVGPSALRFPENDEEDDHSRFRG